MSNCAGSGLAPWETSLLSPSQERAKLNVNTEGRENENHRMLIIRIL